LRTLEHQKAEYIVGEAPIGTSIGTITVVAADFRANTWMFKPSVFSAIVCVHFYSAELVPCFLLSLSRGGYLFVETVGGQGGNHLDLPRAGELRSRLRDFELLHYTERRVGPDNSNAVSAKVLARKPD
jgi:hypothetical protein